MEHIDSTGFRLRALLSDSDYSETSTTTRIQPKPHPLLLYPVMKHLMKLMNIPDLLTMRGVCQTWRAEAVPFLRDKLKIEIGSDTDFVNFNVTMSEADLEYLSCSYLTFTNLNLNLKAFPHLALYDRITVLSVNICDWTSSSLRTIVFEHFPSLKSLKLEALKISGSLSFLTQPVLPMTIGFHESLKPLPNLKWLHLIGDFARRSDAIYEILKFAPNLEGIQVEKWNEREDDLFGTWFFEILLSRQLLNLTCLEIDSALISLQIESLLLETSFKLKRLRLNLTQIQNPVSIVKRILRKFKNLENVEFELSQPSRSILNSISCFVVKEKFAISMHSNSSSRIVFPIYSI